ncbi:MAG: DNA recombination protein RmuC [Oscillospiraceae bacterium]
MLSIITLCLSAAAAVFSLIAILRGKNAVTQNSLDLLRKANEDSMRGLRTELTQSINNTMQSINELQMASQKQISAMQDARLAQMSEQLGERQHSLQKSVTDSLNMVEERMKNSTMQTITQLDSIRNTMETRIKTLQDENSKKLDEMRNVVDEKLQKTLDEKLKQSFSTVSEQLEKVYKGLGEMSTLTTGVGDLKKVLSNVKTRGILGEVQLGAILEQLLSSEQYDTNIATVKGSSERVEYAVKLPGDGVSCVYLPIDAKFPMDAYSNLITAYDTADTAEVEAAAKVLEQRIRSFGKDIHDKYISVPDTTDFGIMFLPVEGLYAEVVRRGMIEKLQTDYHVMIAGPTTMAALLNSLQMGFHTLAIQKRTSEVWEVLGSVKTEFDTFGKALEQAQNRINQAGNELESLIGVRTRQIQRRLRSVTDTKEMNNIEE